MLKLPAKNPDLTPWIDLTAKLKSLNPGPKIAIVGKYVDLKESYKSLHEALVHGGIANSVKPELVYVNSEELTVDNVYEKLKDVQGVLVPGGFGYRGVEGKILACKFAREKKIPFLGICLGMQCAVIEFARNVLKLLKANSSEFDPNTPDPVIYLMTEWFDFRKRCVQKRDPGSDKGGTMRLGAYPCKLRKDTKSYKAYKKKS